MKEVFLKWKLRGVSTLGVILFLGLSLVFPLFVEAQIEDNFAFHTRVTYDVSYIGDSTDVSVVFEEPCYLFIGDEIALSESVESFDTENSDSVHMERIESGVVRLSWAILKEEEKITTYDSFSQVRDDKDWRFVYTEPAGDFDWELQDDTMTIEGLLCQKAICEFGGRTWVAWFSPDIAFSSGPYKFQGLPGLIVSVHDTQDHWKFKIREIERPEAGYVVSMNFFDTYKTTDKEKFFKDQHYYRKNYMEIEEANGKDFINPENRAIMKENAEFGFKQHSNWIELY